MITASIITHVQLKTHLVLLALHVEYAGHSLLKVTSQAQLSCSCVHHMPQSHGPVQYAMFTPTPPTQEPSLYQSLHEWISVPAKREDLCRSVWHIAPNTHIPQKELTATLTVSIDNYGDVSPMPGRWCVRCIQCLPLSFCAVVCMHRVEGMCPSLLSVPS